MIFREIAGEKKKKERKEKGKKWATNSCYYLSPEILGYIVAELSAESTDALDRSFHCGRATREPRVSKSINRCTITLLADSAWSDHVSRAKK